MVNVATKSPEDFVISTGKCIVREFIELCAQLGWDTKEQGILWEGEGINEIGRRLIPEKLL